MYNVFLMKRIMTMIALMSAILVFSAQNSSQIAFKNLKASWQTFSSDLLFQSFESKSLGNFWFSKSLENFWKLFESKSQENF